MPALIISRSYPGSPARQQLVEALAAAGVRAGWAVYLTPDLYHLPEDSPVWTTLAGLSAPLRCAGWLHPRPLEWVLRRHGLTCATALNLTACGDLATATATLLASHPGEREAPAEPGSASAPAEPGRRQSLGAGSAHAPGQLHELDAELSPRWYPVVDEERCVDCGHCQQFCLFGVYARPANGPVAVSHPDLCKPGCPACSRICPHGAIIFPLYAKDEAIAGAPGEFVLLDAAARKLYYSRTQLPCPMCDATGEDPAGTLCPECGRYTRPAEAPDDEFDDLIAALERKRQT
jgi:Pyruvate/2-oxoacid:ferredoxin oxidoreductase delta subunit